MLSRLIKILALYEVFKGILFSLSLSIEETKAQEDWVTWPKLCCELEIGLDLKLDLVLDFSYWEYKLRLYIFESMKYIPQIFKMIRSSSELVNETKSSIFFFPRNPPPLLFSNIKKEHSASRYVSRSHSHIRLLDCEIKHVRQK